MSASEKLKALDADLGIFDGGMHWIDVDGPRAGEAVWKLKTALPQIVAVVSEAEKIQYAVEPLTTPETPLRDALVALEEVLS